jgi:SAM-dependent methyltransferase
MPTEPAEADARHWHHVTFHTYGAWLDGGDRSFRTRHHREHIEGDYKSPPPEGQHAWRKERSERQLKQPPVSIPQALRQPIGELLRDRLTALGVEILCISVSATHVHALLKVERTRARDLLGQAKKHATFESRTFGWKGKLWAVRGRELRIRDRQHQENAYHYILRHADEGAWVWSALWKDEPHSPVAQAQGWPSLGLDESANVSDTSPTSAQAHNAQAWDGLVRQNQRFTRPAPDVDFVDPLRTVDPFGWLGSSIAGKRLLCLAAGGGKHGALYAAAGARVTVVDLSGEMLALDRAVAAERGLDIDIVQASMDNLAALPAGAFEIVIHPVSTCYVPDVLAVYREVARVTAAGGLYISQHKTPTSLQTEVLPGPRGRYELSEPYYRTGPLPPVVGSPHREPGTLEFLHRWEELLGGMCRSGFVIEDLHEPCHAKPDAELGGFAHRSQIVAPYVRIKARRAGIPASRIVLA